MKLRAACPVGLLGSVLLTILWTLASAAWADDPAPAESAEPAAAEAAPADAAPQPESMPADAAAEPAENPPQPTDAAPAPREPASAPAEPAPTEPAPENPAPATAEPAPAATEPASADADAAPAPAAPEKTEPAQAEPPVDPNLALQGEFVGQVKIGKSKPRAVGLQVRPMGADVFEAAQYAGGLPGQGGKNGPTLLLGKRSGDFLALTGGPWLVMVEPDHCQVMDRNGRKIGRLERIVRQSPTLGAPPPAGAEVLFDGSSTDQLSGARVSPEGLLMEGCDVRPLYQDFNLHAEFLLPSMPEARDQARANSGLYLLSRYEVQVLDSFAQEPVFNGCGSLYRQRTPDLNMCLPPLAWQTYDITLVAPRWSADGSKRKNARITVWLNGVKVHNNVELPDKTGAGQPEEPSLLPIRIQDHGNPVRFRNVWIVDRGATGGGRFPVFPVKEEGEERK